MAPAVRFTNRWTSAMPTRWGVQPNWVVIPSGSLKISQATAAG